MVAAAVTTWTAQTVEFNGRLTMPRRPTLALLFALFGAFLFFLTLDVGSVLGTLWKSIVLPLSLVPFLPVWALYWITFVLALLAGTFGIEVTHGDCDLYIRARCFFRGSAGRPGEQPHPVGRVEWARNRPPPRRVVSARADGMGYGESGLKAGGVNPELRLLKAIVRTEAPLRRRSNVISWLLKSQRPTSP
jgi:hypothetical protein